jgi:hypothetical protein
MHAPHDPTGRMSCGQKAKKTVCHRSKDNEPAVPSEPEKAEIAIHDADDLYREIRIENTVVNESGEKVSLANRYGGSGTTRSAKLAALTNSNTERFHSEFLPTLT